MRCDIQQRWREMRLLACRPHRAGNVSNQTRTLVDQSRVNLHKVSAGASHRQRILASEDSTDADDGKSWTQ
jgi:hypothetical protein